MGAQGIKRKAEDALPAKPSIEHILTGDADPTSKLLAAATEFAASTAAAQFFSTLAPFVEALPASSVEHEVFFEAREKSDPDVLQEATFLCRAGLKEESWLAEMQQDGGAVRKVKLFAVLLADAKEDEDEPVYVGAEDEGEEDDESDAAAAAFLAGLTEEDCVERELPEDDPKWVTGRPTAELIEICAVHGHNEEDLAALSRLELVQRVYVSMFTGDMYGDESEGDESEGEED